MIAAFVHNGCLRRAATLTVALTMIVLFSVAGHAGEPGSDTLELIRRIISERGEYDLAERQLRTFIEENRGRPAAAEALVLLGYCLDKQRKNTEAAASYGRALAEFPNAPAALRADAALGAADACFRLERYAEAAEHYTTVLDLTTKNDQAEAALLWRGESRYRAALEAEDDSEEYELLGRAAADFSAFMERFPDSKLFSSALYGMAFSNFDADRHVEALEYFRRFVRDFSGDRRAQECRYYVGECLYRLNRYDEAKVVFGDLLAGGPEGEFAADARAGIAWADYGLRRLEDAASGFEEAAAMASKDRNLALSLLYDAGCAWREAGNAEKAAAPLLEVAKDRDHELNGLAWLRLGTLWQEQARNARLRAENAANPKEREHFLDRQKSMGEDAVQYFRRALTSSKLGDEEREASALLGEVLLDARRYGEAAQAFEETARRWPNSDRAAWALYHQALAEHQWTVAEPDSPDNRDRLRRAAAALEKTLEHPDAKVRLQATWALADYLATLGEAERSREHLRWLAGAGRDWARQWRDSDGKADPALENRAREYAADSLFRLGESFYHAGDHPRAAGYYQEISTEYSGSPQSAMALLRLGEMAEFGRDLPAAQTFYERALADAQKSPKARTATTSGFAQLRLGALMLRQAGEDGDQSSSRRRYQDALRHLTAVTLDPPGGIELDRTFYYLAEAKYGLGLKQEALADYQTSLRTSANGGIADAAWFGLAWVKRDLSDFDGALEACETMVKDFPASRLRPDALSLMASVKRSRGDASGALRDLDEFLAEYPDHELVPRVWLERASALDETGRHADAAESFQQFLADFPEHPDVPQALYQRSWALWNQIRPKAQEAREAEAAWRSLTGGKAALELNDGQRAEAMAAEDKMNALAGEVRAAEEQILASLRDLTERYPDYPVADAAWLRIGEIQYDRGEFTEAMNSYQRAMQVSEDKGSDVADKARYRLAWSLTRLAEQAEADSLTNPERREAARREMWDRRVAAIDMFESILGRYPRSDLVGDSCFRAAELRRRSGQDNLDPAKRSAWFQSAIQRYRQSQEKSSADAPYRRAAEYGEGLSLLLDDKSTEAREVFQQLLRNTDGPYIQEAYWGLGQANLNLGAHADAAAAFEQALAMDRATETAAKSRYGLGLTAVLAGDPDRARLEFLAVSSFYPNYPEWAAAALVRAGRMALEEGLRDNALRDLEEVLAKYPETPAAEEARGLQAVIASGN